jgi:hypothetical protein
LECTANITDLHRLTLNRKVLSRFRLGMYISQLFCNTYAIINAGHRASNFHRD